MHPTITPHFDVALLVLNAFFLFFAGLIFYLRREDRREGYPLEDDLTGRVDSYGGAMHTPSRKLFRLPFGHGTVATPTKGREPFRIAARKTERFSGAPLVPTGNPLIDGIGPAAWAERARRPDLDMEGHARIVPLTTAPAYSITLRDDPRGLPAVGADGKVAGIVSDLWIDKADRMVRYLQIELRDGGRQILAPMMMAKIERRRGRVMIDALLAHQFADAPAIDAADSITLYEEERVVAYFGGGYLYATAARAEPIL